MDYAGNRPTSNTMPVHENRTELSERRAIHTLSEISIQHEAVLSSFSINERSVTVFDDHGDNHDHVDDNDDDIGNSNEAVTAHSGDAVGVLDRFAEALQW